MISKLFKGLSEGFNTAAEVIDGMSVKDKKDAISALGQGTNKTLQECQSIISAEEKATNAALRKQIANNAIKSLHNIPVGIGKIGGTVAKTAKVITTDVRMGFCASYSK
jgi:hypothetical protein